ncbi:MAG: DivIVA domain-containing protein [Actinomycetota bacterium]|nr:DivIVA domain-containing protein [Actinomycetota bacterium]
MVWLWVVALVLVIGASAVIIAGRGDAMTDVYEDRPDLTLDRGRLTADDVAKVRFTTAVRGYRMDEVDAFVERLEAELRAWPGEPLLDEVGPAAAREDTVTPDGSATAPAHQHGDVDEGVAGTEPAHRAGPSEPGRRRRSGGRDGLPAAEASPPPASQPPTRTRGDTDLSNGSNDPAGDTSR